MLTLPNWMKPTLYSPATTDYEKLWPLVNGEDPYVRRIVVCTEDSIADDDVPRALINLGTVVSGMKPDSTTEVFVRVRSPEVMAQILCISEIEKVTGFVIPKADPESFPLYARQIVGHPAGFRLMAILESRHMPDPNYRMLLRHVLGGYRDLIDCLRIGANDLLGHQNLRRDAEEFTIYATPVGVTIYNILNDFRLDGYNITAPVFECFGDQYIDLLRREVRHSIAIGLFGQTVIHPCHLPILFEMYCVDPDEWESAQDVLGTTTAVQGHNGRMTERSVHYGWAETILARAQLFGVRPPKNPE